MYFYCFIFDKCQWTTENKCPPNTYGFHLANLTWRNRMKKRKTNFQAEMNLLFSWTSTYFILHSECKFLSCTTSCSSLICSAVLCHSHCGKSRAGLQLILGHMLLYRAKSRAVYKQVCSQHPYLSSSISIRSICPEEHDGIFTPLC